VPIISNSNLYVCQEALTDHNTIYDRFRIAYFYVSDCYGSSTNIHHRLLRICSACHYGSHRQFFHGKNTQYLPWIINPQWVTWKHNVRWLNGIPQIWHTIDRNRQILHFVYLPLVVSAILPIRNGTVTDRGWWTVPRRGFCIWFIYFNLVDLCSFLHI
jgi:hypothetical protein